MGIGPLSFLMPWAFVGFALLPLMWLLMKTTPPKPQKIRFPAVRLLQELSTEKIVATKTPWWVLLIRCLLVVMLIMALSQPVINQAKTIGDSQNPVVLIVDNDWSVMDRWAEREQELALMVEQAKRANRPVMLVPTANILQSDPLSFEKAEHTQEKLSRLLVKPWQSDRSGWLIKLENSLGQREEAFDIFWISNGLREGTDSRFAERLAGLGTLHVITDARSQIPAMIQKVKRTKDGLNVEIQSIATDRERPLQLQMLDDQGTILFIHDITLKPDHHQSEINLIFPEELRSKTERIRLAKHLNPGAQFLMDERWRDKAVGIMAHSQTSQSLMEATFYLEKAMNPYVNTRFDTLDYLLERDLSLLIDLGQETMDKDQKQTVLNWIENGGIFIRFANEAHSLKSPREDPLLPVQLLRGMRTFGGSMSWKEDPRLAPFDVDSPFAGIKQHDEILIHQQVLARPSTQIAGSTWAQLRDGTPLITSKKIGNGYSVLFHISANPKASDLPYSGVFEEMMVRLVSLSTGFSSADPDAQLNPYLVFDSNGQLSPAPDQVRALKVKQMQELEPSAFHPPGLYGQAQSLKSYNFGPHARDLIALDNLPAGARQADFDQVHEINLVPWALFAVLMLALLDWITTLRLKKYFKPAALAFILYPLLSPLSVQASQGTDWLKSIEAANDMRLAYMVTGDPTLDQISKRGLVGLNMILRQRTAVEFSEPMPFNPEVDDPVLFPMIYWPVTSSQADLSSDASKRLNRFLRAGGFILFDTQGTQQQEVMTRLGEQLDIGQLTQVQDPHVMTKSFYLMQKFPGRFNHPEIWVEAAENASRDRVSSILVGSNSWAHAWARDDQLRPLYPVVPGGEIQREQAYRFGVNLVMYVLSGNYKADQVHMPTIIQRLGL